MLRSQARRLGIALLCFAGSAGAAGAEEARSVTALGRITPRHGVLKVYGPSVDVVVVERLFVEEGDSVQAGQVLAQLDTYGQRSAEVEQMRSRIALQDVEIVRLEAELRFARSDDDRRQRLQRDGLLPDSEAEAARLRLDVAQATLARARAQLDASRADLKVATVALERSRVLSPVAARVVKIHAREGERVPPSGIAELARAGAMYAVAEVYETEIPRVKPGQAAVVKSPGFPGEWRGRVERVGLKVGKMDVLGTDPAARADARVVEVEIRLEASDALFGLTNLQVEVTILER
jgi:HlyD family secretion protein